MRLLHTSDWHVGRKIRGRSRASEHREVLAEIATIADRHRVDLILVAGDLFDVSSPSPEDEEIVYTALLALSEVAPVALVAGNHDGAGRLEALRPLLGLGRITALGTPRPPEAGGVVDYPEIGVSLALLPFISQRGIVRTEEIMTLDPDQHAQGYEARMRRVITALAGAARTDRVNVVMGHLTVYGATAGGGERDAHIFGYALPPQVFPGSLSYVALGHLHRLQRISAAAPVWYSGSPLQLDFGERQEAKGVLVVEAEPGRPAGVETVPLAGGVPLVQLEGTLAQVLARAGEVEGAHVKVILEEPARSGLNDEVREAIPGVVEVRLSRPEHQVRPRPVRSGRSHWELFAEYLKTQEVEEGGLVELFRRLEEEAAG